MAKAENLGGYNNGPSYSGYQGARLGRDSHRAQAIREVSIASRAITVVPAAMVLQEVTAGTV